eukprot:7216506-Alexandrium_andersonii.AAC.1
MPRRSPKDVFGVRRVSDSVRCSVGALAVSGGCSATRGTRANWPLALQERRIARIADWRIADWSLR